VRTLTAGLAALLAIAAGSAYSAGGVEPVLALAAQALEALAARLGPGGERADVPLAGVARPASPQDGAPALELPGDPSPPNELEPIALEASELRQPGDVRPRLVEVPPDAWIEGPPDLSPEIALRLLVNEQGAVAAAAILRRRPELAPLEEAALQAARRYRFTPARRGAKPVAVWIHMTLPLRSAREKRSAPGR
jgi:TonB family protein